MQMAMRALLIVLVLDYRCGWSNVPAWMWVFGDFPVALGLTVNPLAFRANSYGASTIEKKRTARL